MSREKLSFSSTPTVNPGDMQKDEEVSGKFLGLKVVKIPGREDPSTLIRLTDVNGVEFGLWANKSIEQRVMDLQEGEVYIFVALGEMKNQKTGRKFKGFDVYHGTSDELTFDLAEAQEPEPKPVSGRGRK